jgi:hypothetical protein
MPSISGFFPDETNRVMQEFVTPRYLATSAPEYPNSQTAAHETTLLALIISRLRLPEQSSVNDILFFLQTLLDSVHPEMRYFGQGQGMRSR